MVAFISLLTAAAAASVAPSRPAVGSGPLTLEPSTRLGVRQISERSDLSLLRLRGGEQQSTYAMLKPDIAGDADSDEEDYDALRVASAAKRRKEEVKEEKARAREEAKAASLKKQKKTASATPGSSKKASRGYDDTYDDDTDSSEDDGGAGLSGADPAGASARRARAGRDNAGFLEAPAEPEARSDSSGSDTDSDDPDDISDGEKAEILAIGKNMIRKKDRVRFFLFRRWFFFALRRRRRASVFRSLVDARRRSTFLVTVFRNPLSALPRR